MDEYLYCKELGKEEAERRLTEHWSTWYTETDFKNISDFGFNMVRIPIGYWAFETLDLDPYVLGAQEYLDKAIGWAYKHNLKVWVDLHGVPGSQNGFDNLGRFLANKPEWQKEQEYQDLTYTVLRQIYRKYGSANFTAQYPDTIIGIEVVNEPFGPALNMTQVSDFYRKTYREARLLLDTNNTMVFHDAFQLLGYWNDFQPVVSNTSRRVADYNILIDHHHYEVFSSSQLELLIAEHIESVKSYGAGIVDELDYHPAVVGEWSAALTDCCPWLNSVGYGTRWEGTAPFTNKKIKNKQIGKCANINTWSAWTEAHKADTRKYIEIQLDEYGKSNGWIFWCFKTETSIEWDFVRLAQYGLFPVPFDDRKYIKNGTDTDPAASAGHRSFVSLFAAIAGLILVTVV